MTEKELYIQRYIWEHFYKAGYISCEKMAELNQLNLSLEQIREEIVELGIKNQ